MFFNVDLNSSKAVYQQLIDQIKFAVASGRLKTGDRLPAIRDVAAELRVNRNTIARVYTELEREGVVYTHAGQGCFISDRGSSLSRAEQRKKLTSRIDELLADAHHFDFTADQITDMFQQRLNIVFSNSSSAQGGKAK
jgi:GntR family transcriptional regulator